MKVISRERLDIHLGTRQQVADRDRLKALGGRVGGHDDIHTFADERQLHLHEHLLRLARARGERRRLAIGKALASGTHDIPPRRNVGESDLAERVARRAGDRHVAVEAAELDLNARDAQSLDRNGHDDAPGA